MRKITLLVLVLIIYLIALNAKAQGYEIKIEIPKLKNEPVILGHYLAGSKMKIADDTTVLNKDGMGVFKGDKKLPGGMYFMLLPSRNFFEFIISDKQQFTIESDTTDFYKALKISNFENQLFIKTMLFKEKQFNKINELSEEYKNTEVKKRKDEIVKRINELNTEIAKKINDIVSANPNIFFSKFLKATQEVKIPESITAKEDKYYYYRSNYFKYFDYKDQRLLRTPIYQDKLDKYIDKVLPQIPDTLITEVDVLIKNSRHDKELFRFMLVHLFNKFGASNLMGAENVWLHIAEKYYIPEADWSDKEYIEELKTKVARKKPGLIGNRAPELKLIMLPKDSASIETVKEAIAVMKNNGDEFMKNETLIKEKMEQYKLNYPNLSDSTLRSQLIISELALLLEEQLLPTFEGYISLHKQAAKYTILWFWEPDCSHCKTETPKFSKIYDEKRLQDLGVTVIPVYLHRNINEWDRYIKSISTWLDFMLEHNMLKWTNVWEPFGYSRYRDKYNISSSPVLYLLDKEKKIIAKRISYTQAIEIIEDIEKRNELYK